MKTRTMLLIGAIVGAVLGMIAALGVIAASAEQQPPPMPALDQAADACNRHLKSRQDPRGGWEPGWEDCQKVIDQLIARKKSRDSVRDADDKAALSKAIKK
jgi:hypothetical protein